MVLYMKGKGIVDKIKGKVMSKLFEKSKKHLNKLGYFLVVNVDEHRIRLKYIDDLDDERAYDDSYVNGNIFYKDYIESIKIDENGSFTTDTYRKYMRNNLIKKIYGSSDDYSEKLKFIVLLLAISVGMNAMMLVKIMGLF